MVGTFLVFFALFATVIYPNAAMLHPTAWCQWLAALRRQVDDGVMPHGSVGDVLAEVCPLLAGEGLAWAAAALDPAHALRARSPPKRRRRSRSRDRKRRKRSRSRSRGRRGDRRRRD